MKLFSRILLYNMYKYLRTVNIEKIIIMFKKRTRKINTNKYKLKLFMLGKRRNLL